MSENKVCFVIAPIGLDDSDIRKRSDQIFKHVIEPVAKECGYKAIRADHMSQPGSITTQIVDQILSAPLVVADLTGHNANVLYELAIRHVVRKPVVQLIQQGEGLPFDVAAQRTIQVDHKDLDSVAVAKVELSKQILNVEKDPTQVDSPVSIALDLSALRSSTKPVDATLVEIVSLLHEIRTEQQAQASRRRRERLIDALVQREQITTSLLDKNIPIGSPTRIREGWISKSLAPHDVFGDEGKDSSGGPA
ncbi:MAG: hypothetical protein RI101_08595 [Nitrospira sp.]|jgi:hypothetical protein|nr:hypothetical protein [Nitrospira sp.]